MIFFLYIYITSSIYIYTCYLHCIFITQFYEIKWSFCFFFNTCTLHLQLIHIHDIFIISSLHKFMTLNDLFSLFFYTYTLHLQLMYTHDIFIVSALHNLIRLNNFLFLFLFIRIHYIFNLYIYMISSLYLHYINLLD